MIFESAQDGKQFELHSKTHTTVASGGRREEAAAASETSDRTESCPRCGFASAHGCAGSALAPASPAPPGSPPPPAAHEIQPQTSAMKKEVNQLVESKIKELNILGGSDEQY